MNYILLHSHHGAPYEKLLESLSELRGVYAGRTGIIYDHPLDLIRLKERDRWAITFIDTILENKELQSQAVEKSVKNIFLFGGTCENENYLRFRLRRMYELWRKNGGIVLAPNIDNWNKLEEMFNNRIEKLEIPSGNEIVEKYLSKFKLHMV